jgi:hypothetical protein
VELTFQRNLEWWGILIDSVDQLLCALVQQDPEKDKGGTCAELMVFFMLFGYWSTQLNSVENNWIQFPIQK